MRLDRFVFLTVAGILAAGLAGSLQVYAQQAETAQPAEKAVEKTVEKAAEKPAPAKAAAAPADKKAGAAEKKKEISKKDIVEGYAKPDYNELLQSAVVLGGYDIDNPRVAQEYAKQLYCPLYQKYYADDFSWSEEKKRIVARVKSKKEPYRVQYEYGGVIKLDRYDTASQSFPLSRDTRLNNVGHMEVISPEATRNTQCLLGIKSEDKKDPFFPPRIGLLLNKPLTLMSMPLSPEKGDALLAKLKARGIIDRSVFVRFRFRVFDQPKLVHDKKRTVARIDLGGHLQAIDFFLDREMTMWLASVPVE